MNGILEWLIGIETGELSGREWRIGLVSDYNNYIRLGLLLLLAALVWLTVHCYRREGRSRPTLRLFLGGLRVAVIALTLLILFQPSVIVDITENFYSTVVFLVDDSLSMSFADGYGGKDQEAFRRRLAEQLVVPPERLAGMSRSDILAAGIAAGINDEFRRFHPVEVMKFSTDTPPGKSGYTVSIGGLPRTAETDEGAAGSSAGSLKEIMKGLTAGGFETDYAPAIRDVLAQFQGRRLGAIVVLGDGRATLEGSGRRLDAALAATAQRGVPRYAVLVGDPVVPENVALTGIRAPRDIRAGSSIELTVLLSARNVTAESVTVALYRKSAVDEWPADLAGLEPLQEKRAKLDRAAASAGAGTDGGREEKEVVFRVKTAAGEKGEYVYRAVARPLENERAENDNWAEIPVTISEKKLRILLVSGDAGWEFQHLRNYLLRQPDLYRVSVWQQDAGRDINQHASSGMKLSRLPRSLGEMIDAGEDHSEGVPRGYHVIILYDPMPTEGGYDGTFLGLLKEYVSRHGGGLCYIASNKNTWSVLQDSAAKPLRDILPVVVASNREDLTSLFSKSGINVGYPVKPTVYGVDHPLMRLTGDASSSMEMWSIMPGIYWSHSIQEHKPHARVLAVSTHPSHTTAADEPEPVLAVHAPGKGKVVYLGFDESWRWRVVEEGFYYRRFWSNVINYLATKSDSRVIINTGGDRFRVGDKITVVVEAYNRDYTAFDAKQFELNMIDAKTGERTAYILGAVKNQPGMFKTTIEAGRAGRFRFTCDPSFAPPDKVAMKRIRVTMPRAEALRPEASPRTMKRIASRKEFYLGADEIERLPELIPRGVRTTRRQRSFSLWDTRLMWILLVALLATEWYLRKRANLV